MGMGIISKLEDLESPILLLPCGFPGSCGWPPNCVAVILSIFFLLRREYSSVQLPATGEISAKICVMQLKYVLYFMSFGSSWN